MKQMITIKKEEAHIQFILRTRNQRLKTVHSNFCCCCCCFVSNFNLLKIITFSQKYNFHRRVNYTLHFYLELANKFRL
jgi:hypothetical protein